MTEQKRPRLTSPFKNVQTLSKGGRSLSYVPASEIVDRLNCCLGVGKWSFSCEAWRDERDPDFVISKGQLTVHALNDEGIGSCVIEQYGGQQVNRTKNGDIIDLADDFKGSSSDALKKCASHIGVALYLSLGHPPLSARLGEVVEEGGGVSDSAQPKGDKATGKETQPVLGSTKEEGG